MRITKRALLWTTLLPVWVIFTVVFFPENLSSIQAKNYIVYLITGILFLVVFIFFSIKNNCGVKDIFVFLSFVYFALFWIAPVYDVIIGYKTWYGVKNT